MYFKRYLPDFADSVNNTSNDEYTVLILGATGKGKSSLGNDLLGYEAFDSRDNPGGVGVTQNFTVKNGIFGNKKLKVIDSPGSGDTNISPQKILEELYKAAGGKNQINAIIYVVSALDTRLEEATKIAIVLA
jgi:predicted GTPase